MYQSCITILHLNDLVCLLEAFNLLALSGLKLLLGRVSALHGYRVLNEVLPASLAVRAAVDVEEEDGGWMLPTPAPHTPLTGGPTLLTGECCQSTGCDEPLTWPSTICLGLWQTQLASSGLLSGLLTVLLLKGANLGSPAFGVRRD